MTKVEIAKLYVKFLNVQNHVAEVLRVKRTVSRENWAPHLLEKSDDFYRGLAAGSCTAIEDVLHLTRHYKGYVNVNGDKRTEWLSPGSAGYEEYIREYLLTPELKEEVSKLLLKP